MKGGESMKSLGTIMGFIVESMAESILLCIVLIVGMVGSGANRAPELNVMLIIGAIVVALAVVRVAVFRAVPNVLHVFGT
jgi:hypothetical protein